MRIIKGWETTVVAATCTVVGLFFGGWFGGGGGTHATGAESDAAEPEAHAGELSDATLANLGVVVAPIETSVFVRTVAVAATVVETPATEQPVFAPIGGRIASVEVELGTTVAPGAAVVTLIRDPLPRPQLTLTAEVLRPAQEELHRSALALRRSAEELRIARTELERVEGFTGNVGGRDLPIIPRQRAIDLRYQVSRAETAHEQARLELQTHGLLEEQIREIEQGAPLPEFDEQTWQRALARNGLWPAEAQALMSVLPASLRALPWVTATVGELAASGLATPELTAWLDRTDAAEHFLEIGVLLQRGHTLDDLERLHEMNALEPVVRVVAPPLDEGARWDVTAIGTKRGETVAAGDRLLTLADPRRLLLRSKPIGGEVAAVLHAARGQARLTAEPLVPGSGPSLEGLGLGFVESAHADGGTVAFVEVENRVHSEIDRGEGRRSRTWALRAGTEYLLQVPAEQLENVYVLPSSAVTERGPDQVVFLRDGESFRAIPVAIAYRDDEVVVIPATGAVSLFPGDPVVVAGAFELGLALDSGDAVDPHAGHNH